MGRGGIEFELADVVRQGLDFPTDVELEARGLAKYLTPQRIDQLAPTHGRTSCSDAEPNGNYYAPEHGHPRCLRCALRYLAENDGYGPYGENVKLTVKVETTVVYDGERQREYREREQGRSSY